MPEPTTEDQVDERVRRPTPARTEPDRTPMFNAAISPIPAAVADAYRVCERYLEEGRSYAQGESAWYRRPESHTGDPTAALVRIADQIGRASTVLRSLLPPSCPIARALDEYDARRDAVDGRSRDDVKWTKWFGEATAPEPNADTGTIQDPERRWPEPAGS